MEGTEKHVARFCVLQLHCRSIYVFHMSYVFVDVFSHSVHKPDFSVSAMLATKIAINHSSEY